MRLPCSLFNIKISSTTRKVYLLCNLFLLILTEVVEVPQNLVLSRLFSFQEIMQEEHRYQDGHQSYMCHGDYILQDSGRIQKS